MAEKILGCVQWIFTVRWSVLTTTLLVGFGPLALYLVPRLLANTLILEGQRQTILLWLISLIAASTNLNQYVAVSSDPLVKNFVFIDSRWIFIFIVGGAIPLCACCYSVEEESLCVFDAILGTLVGIVVGVGLLLVAAYLSDLLIVNAAARPYVNIRLVAVALLFFVLYAILIYAEGLMPIPKSKGIAYTPTAFYIILLITLTGLVTAGLAHLFDQTKTPIPILLPIAIYVTVVYGIGYTINRVHSFDIRHSVVQPKAVETKEPVEPPMWMATQNPTIQEKTIEPREEDELLDKSGDRFFRAAEKLTGRQATFFKQMMATKADGEKESALPEQAIIFVSAPGGGIHAAAWTATVLTKLEQAFPDRRFAHSLYMISSTSGGSVGAYFYAMKRVQLWKNRLFDENVAEEIRQNAMASSLETVASGLVLRDLFWLVQPLPIVDDRGRSLEKRWMTLAGEQNANPITLKTWRNDTFFLAINATQAKTGRRVVFAPLKLPQSASAHGGTSAIEVFTKLDTEQDVAIVSAVRMSASFPYVSPIARPAEDVAGRSIDYLADGGYADNDGVRTIVETIKGLVQKSDNTRELKKTRLIVLEFQHYVPKESANPSSSRGVWYDDLQLAMAGPMMTAMQSQTTGQAERKESELDLLDGWLKAYPNFKLERVPFVFAPPERDRTAIADPPLNWALTQRQKKRYQESWDQPDVQEQVKRLARLLPAVNSDADPSDAPP
jgi:predicted acylesterase/phospholipase RssA